MSGTTKIEWTDRTWTPVVGCDPVSPACAFCYAALMAARLEAMGQEKYAGLATRHGNRGKWTGKVTLWEPELLAPLKVRKPQTWFLTSMGDVGHEAVPDEFLDRLFAVMALCPQHTFYVLTKRPGRLAGYLGGRRWRPVSDWGRMEPCNRFVARAFDNIASSLSCAGIHVPTHILTFGQWATASSAIMFETPGAWPLPNVLIGCTAEDQPRADERRPAMASIAAAGWRTFVSYEPALGPVDWSGWGFLAWLISGGESGQHARPSHPDWHRTARDWCVGAGVPFLFKQWGEWWADKELDCVGGPGYSDACVARQHNWDDGCTTSLRVGKNAAGRLLDSVEYNGGPK